MKLRKHLCNLRLENVTQLGNLDRVIDFRFGSGAYAHHLILELYAQGNILLCDGEYPILALLRTHQYEVTTTNGSGGEEGMKGAAAASAALAGGDGKEEVKVRVGTIYPVTFATTLTVVGTNNEGALFNKIMGLLTMNASEATEWAKTELSLVQNRALLAVSSNEEHAGRGMMKGGRKQKKKAMDDLLVLKALLLKPNSGVYHYGPSLIEHCILTAGIDPVIKLTFDNIEGELTDALWTELLSALRCEGEKVIQNLTLGEGGGYILYKNKGQMTTGNQTKVPSSHRRWKIIIFIRIRPYSSSSPIYSSSTKINNLSSKQRSPLPWMCSSHTYPPNASQPRLTPRRLRCMTAWPRSKLTNSAASRGW